jgi:plastocyanin
MAARSGVPPASVARCLSLILVLAVASCGGDDAAAPEDDGPFTGTIRVLDNRFSPPSVTIAAGDSVTWRWDGSTSHTVTHGTSPDPAQDPTRLFDTPLKSSGTFGYRFTSAGSYPYFCRPHFSMGMTGTITVTP